MEWKNSITSGGHGRRADVERGQLVHPEPLADRGGLLVGAGLDRRLELLEDPRHGEEPRRAHLGEVAHDLARVRAAGDREAELHREVVRAVALGDVRHRQVGDDAAAALVVQHLVVRAHREQHALVREHDALGVAGRARGVDERQRVVGLDRLPGGVEVEVVVGRELVEVVDVEHVLGVDAVAELLLDDGDLRAGVAQEELHLLGRRGVVHRERERAEVHRRGVHEVELRAVGEHQRERVAAAQPEGVEAGGDAAHPVGVLAPGDLGLAVFGAESDAVRVLTRRRLEHGADRVSGHVGQRTHDDGPHSAARRSCFVFAGCYLMRPRAVDA